MKNVAVLPATPAADGNYGAEVRSTELCSNKERQGRAARGAFPNSPAVALAGRGAVLSPRERNARLLELRLRSPGLRSPLLALLFLPACSSSSLSWISGVMISNETNMLRTEFPSTNTSDVSIAHMTAQDTRCSMRMRKSWTEQCVWDRGRGEAFLTSELICVSVCVSGLSTNNIVKTFFFSFFFFGGGEPQPCHSDRKRTTN